MQMPRIKLDLQFCLTIVMCTSFVQTVQAQHSCEDIFVAASELQQALPLFGKKTLVALEMRSDFGRVARIAREARFLESADKDAPRFLSEAELVDLEKPNIVLDGKVRPRGNTSLLKDEASFPKLRFIINDNANLTGTLFRGVRKFRINTHISNNPIQSHTPLGRLNGENSPLREGLAYSIAQRLGLVTPATQLAKIKYVDIVANTEFTRNALLIETDKGMSKRLRLKLVEPANFISSTASNVDPITAAKVFLFHRLIGNDDFGLRVHEPPANSMGGSYMPLWNTTLLRSSDGIVIPSVYDLDMSTFVSGYEIVRKGMYNNLYFNLNSHERSLFMTKFLVLRQKFTSTELKTAVAFFKSKKEELYQIVSGATVDDAGREIALKHLSTFFDNLDEAMSLSIVTSDKIPFFKDVGSKDSKLRSDPIEGDEDGPGYLRPGTPIVVLEKLEGLLKVAILDINYDLKPGESSVGYIPFDSSIGKALPSRFVGRIDNRDLLSK